jgi:hypothetical protein
MGHVVITVTVTNIKRHDTVCVKTCARKWGEKSDNKQWYDHLAELVETGHEVNCGINKCERTELFLTINRTALSIV